MLRCIDLIKAMSERNKFLKSETKILLEIKHSNIIQIYQIIKFEIFLFVLIKLALYRMMADILSNTNTTIVLFVFLGLDVHLRITVSDLLEYQ